MLRRIALTLGACTMAAVLTVSFLPTRSTASRQNTASATAHGTLQVSVRRSGYIVASS
jgi:hypothetical protein